MEQLGGGQIIEVTWYHVTTSTVVLQYQDRLLVMLVRSRYEVLPTLGLPEVSTGT
jgi:hypothetical protein